MSQPSQNDPSHSADYCGFSDSRTRSPSPPIRFHNLVPQQWEDPVGGTVSYDYGSEGQTTADSAWYQTAPPPQGPLHSSEPLTASSMSDVPMTADSPTVLPPVSSSAPEHDYRVVDEQKADEWLTCYKYDRFTSYRCIICEKELASQLKARLHVQAHMGEMKLECVVCGAKFSSESSAKRHRKCQFKMSRCEKCNNLYAREDYITSPAHRASCGQRLWPQ